MTRDAAERRIDQLAGTINYGFPTRGDYAEIERLLKAVPLRPRPSLSRPPW